MHGQLLAGGIRTSGPGDFPTDFILSRRPHIVFLYPGGRISVVNDFMQHIDRFGSTWSKEVGDRILRENPHCKVVGIG